MRLSKQTIREILIANSQGVPKAAIARQFEVDVSTVRYHVEMFERTYGTSDKVYAVIRPIQQACTHPSLKCLVCGQAHDNIHRRELEEITSLKIQLAEAQALIERYQGADAV